MDYQTIKAAVEKKGYAFFDSGDFNLNFIWVRNDYHATNHFTDNLYVPHREGGEEKVLDIECTTKPGLKGSLLNPVTVEGITGTAVIEEGQYRGAWQFIDSYTEFSSYPFFRQIKNINYWRDGNRDTEIDKVNEQRNRLFGTQWHRMSRVGVQRKIEDFEIDGWSLGCMGAPVEEWDKVIELTRRAIASGQHDVFTGTIMCANDFLI